MYVCIFKKYWLSEKIHYDLKRSLSRLGGGRYFTQQEGGYGSTTPTPPGGRKLLILAKSRYHIVQHNRFISSNKHFRLSLGVCQDTCEYAKFYRVRKYQIIELEHFHYCSGKLFYQMFFADYVMIFVVFWNLKLYFIFHDFYK
jgi:hypothetical protein